MAFRNSSALQYGFALALLLASPATMASAHTARTFDMAQDDTSEAEAEHHDAHIHGLAQLTVAIDGQIGEITFQTATDNVFGFERLPRTVAEQAIMDKQIALLKQGNWLEFSSKAQCKVTTQELKHGLRQEHFHDNLTATYRVFCQHHEALESLKLSIFSAVPALERVNVQWLLDEQQGAVALSEKQPLLRFKAD